MAKTREEDLGHGDDSFLDIVANLVGVMIILIVVVGVRTQIAAKSAVETGIAEKFEKELEAPIQKANMLEEDLVAQAEKLESYALEVNFRRAERDRILDKINSLKLALDDELAQHDSSEKEAILASQEQSEMERQLAELLKQQGDALNQAPSTVVLQHLPTPMAKTVFNKEVHLLLRHGKLSVIPWDRLVESLKQQVQLAVRRNTRKELIDDRLGPIGGFVMEYRLVAKRGVVTNGSSTGMGQMITLDRFELEPTGEVVAESIEETLADGGRLSMELAGRNPKETVTTVWVYPDSFAQFRLLKDQLFTRGFLTAARPLPEGIRVGAAPSGSHSTAQ